MELKDGGGFLRKSEELPEQAFTIKASAKAFSILSSQLYTNKIRAIIRELSCNALDAHVAAGTEDKQFLLQLPTSNDPTFRIRDYGTGISPSDIIAVYTTYFESTKSTSNAFIGALGLGSKTPFCYTDNFQVNSYFNGKKYLYAAFISDDGMPSISSIGVEDTAEANGLEISFSVQNKDFDAFRKEAENVYFWFKKVPNVIGYKLNIPKLATSLSGNNWRTVTIPYGYAGPGVGAHVVMGSVAYRVDKTSFSQLDAAQQAALSLNLHIEVPIGAVEVAANRENLSLNKSTIVFLKKTLTDIAVEARAQYEKELDALPNLWEACIYRNEKISHLDADLRAIVEASPLKYKGKELHKVLKNDIASNGSYSFLCFSRGISQSTGEAVSRKEWENHIYPASNTAFVIVPKEYKETRIRAWCRKNDKEFTRIVVVDQAIVDKYEISADFAFKIDELPEPARDPKSSRAGSTGKKKDQIYEFLFDENFARNFSKLVTVDFEEDGGVYVKSKFKKPFIGATETTLHTIQVVVEQYNKLYPKKKITKIYGLTETQIKEIADNDDWQEISELLNEAAEEQLADAGVVNYAVAQKLASNLTKQTSLGVVKHPIFTELRKEIGDKHPLNEFFEVFKTHEAKASSLRGKYEPADEFLRSHSVARLVDGLAAKVQSKIDASVTAEYTKEVLSVQNQEQALFDSYPALLLFATPKVVKHSNAKVAKVLRQSF